MNLNKSNCQNCGQTVTENFCSNCGQRKYKRIDKKYIFDEIQYTMLHSDKGFLYSVKNIIKNPGKTARKFIDGSRVSYYKPIPLALVLSGISTFISYKIIGINAILKQYYTQQGLSSEFMNDMLSFFASYMSLVLLCLIPILAICTKIAFRKWGHNYYEHVIMNTHILSFYTIISILLVSPVMYIFRNNVGAFMAITTISTVAISFVFIWFYRVFYKDKKLKSIILRVLLVLFLAVVAYLVLIYVCIIVIVSIQGPEALQYMQAK